jgi:hypothetical protein
MVPRRGCTFKNVAADERLPIVGFTERNDQVRIIAAWAVTVRERKLMKRTGPIR